MSQLKMRFKFNEIEFEIEGTESTVRREFEQLKQFVVGELGKTALPASTPETLSKPSATVSSLPAIDTINGDRFKAESDWIMVFALYASNGSDTPFSVSELRNNYRASGRGTTQRVNNIRNNMKTLLNKGLLIDVDGSLVLSKPGLKYATRLISGKGPVKGSRKKTGAKRGRKPIIKTTVAPVAKELKPAFVLDKAQTASYLKLISSKQAKKNNERIATTLKWFHDEGKTEVTTEELRTALATGGKIPAALGAVLTQMRSAATPLFTSPGRGRMVLSEAGTKYVTNELPAKKGVRSTSVKTTTIAKAKGTAAGRGEANPGPKPGSKRVVRGKTTELKAETK